MTETTAVRRTGSASLYGVACAVGASAFVVAALAQPALPGALWPPLLSVAGSVLVAAGPLGLRRAGAAGSGRAAAIGLSVAAAAWLVGALGSVVSLAVGQDAVALYATSTALAFVGMLAAGLAVARKGLWRGWRRGVPLLCALWLVAVIWFLPRDDVVGGIALASWALTWLALGVALVRDGEPA